MIFKESGDTAYLFFLSFFALVFSFLSITVDLVERLYDVLGNFISERAIDFFFNFTFLILAGLIFFYYRRWRSSEFMRKELDDILASIDPDVMIVIDESRRISMCNTAVTRMFGFVPDEVIGQRTDRLYKDRRSLDPNGREIHEVLDREGFHVGFATGVKKDATEIPLEIITAVLRKRKGAVLLIRDVTDRRRAEESLMRAHDAYQFLFDEFPMPIRLSDAAGKSVAFNRAWLRLTGRTGEEEAGHLWMEGVFPEDRERVDEMIKTAVRDKGSYETVFRIKAADGEYRWIIENCRFLANIKEDQGGFVSSCYDITERVVQERQLSYLATHDPLTDLPNRILFLDRLKLALADADRDKKKVAVVFLDLDNFKDINDRLGHRGGDVLLKGVAERLNGCTRLGDTVARFGGDEFIIILPGLETDAHAAVVANRISDSFSQPFLYQGNEVFVALTLGISLYPTDSTKIENLISLADKAMYKAKVNGKSSSSFYSDDLNTLVRHSGSKANG